MTFVSGTVFIIRVVSMWQLRSAMLKFMGMLTSMDARSLSDCSRIHIKSRTYKNISASTPNRTRLRTCTSCRDRWTLHSLFHYLIYFTFIPICSFFYFICSILMLPTNLLQSLNHKTDVRPLATSYSFLFRLACLALDALSPFQANCLIN